MLRGAGPESSDESEPPHRGSCRQTPQSQSCCDTANPDRTLRSVTGGFGGGRGRGRGWFGGGRGWRHRYWATGVPGWAAVPYADPPVYGQAYPNVPVMSPEQEKGVLEEQAEFLKQELEDLQKRITSLEATRAEEGE